jgi:hypothetical protein
MGKGGQFTSTSTIEIIFFCREEELILARLVKGMGARPDHPGLRRPQCQFG